jgi:hypothetical protein
MSAEHGPSIEWQQMSPFEMEQARIDAAQKGRDLELKGQKSADDLRVSAETSRRQADEQVYSIQKELTAVKQAMTGPGIKPRDAIDRINELNDELKSAKARRDSIYFGRDAAAPQTAELTDEEKAMAKAGPGTKRPTAPAPTQSVTSTSARASAPPSAMSADPTIGAGLPYQQQVAMQQEKIKGDLASQQKAKQEKTTAMNKLIEDAQGDHMRLRSMKDQVDRMIQLSKEGIGSRVMGQLPFGMGEAFQRAWSGRNDELQSLRGPAIQLFMSANSSKMMDTPKEVERLTGGVPDVGRDEDVNKRNAAIMGNDFYSSLQKTPAMEWWSHNKGTMDGFSQAWDDWRQHNPQYTVSVKNGQTYLDDAPYVMPPTKWMQLRKKYSSEQIKTLQERGLDYKD